MFRTDDLRVRDGRVLVSTSARLLAQSQASITTSRALSVQSRLRLQDAHQLLKSRRAAFANP